MICVFLYKNKLPDTNSVAEEVFITVITEFSNFYIVIILIFPLVFCFT